MKINLEEAIDDTLEGNWYHYVRSKDFAWLSRPAYKNLEVNDELLREARLQLRGALRQDRANQFSFSAYRNNILQLFSTPPKLALGTVTILILGIIIGSNFMGREKLIVAEKEPDFINASLLENNT